MPSIIKKRRILSYGGLTLPSVGPFATSPKLVASSLPNWTITTNTSCPLHTRANPLKYNTIDFAGATPKTLYPYTSAIFIRCNLLVRTGAVFTQIFNGGNGGYGFDEGSIGGDGSSGGGAGAEAFTDAGNGGSGDDGIPSDTIPGGLGYGNIYNFDYAFYPQGGDGGDGGFGLSGGNFGLRGFKGNGYGGGGGGGGGDSSGVRGAGGGGAGGLTVIVANESRGAIFFDVSGGGGGNGDATTGGGGGGGSGAIYLAFKKYDGLITALAAGGTGGFGYINGNNGASGTIAIYEIGRDNSLTARTLASTWNNL